MKLSWVEVPPGSTVLGKDGYEWEVRSIQTGAAPGRIRVTMFRDGRGEMTGEPPVGALADVTKLAKDPDMENAVKLLKDALGAEVLSCGWCSGDGAAECICDFNCGRQGCVNF